MDDHLKELGVVAGIGAAVGVGLAIGMGLRLLATGALIGIGAGAAIGLATTLKSKVEHGGIDGMLPTESYPALH